MEQQPFILTNVPRHELSTLITEAVAAALKQSASEPSSNTKPPDETVLLSRRETAVLLKISLVTLYNKVKKGVIPCYRIGRRVLFKESEVLACLTPSGRHR